MHSVMVDGFNNGGPGGIALTYKGPDTEGKLESVQSADAAARPAPPPSHWRLRVWSSATNLQAIPKDFADVVHVGDAVIPEVDFSGQGAGTLAAFVPNTPAKNLAWQAWGKLSVYTGGTYRFCCLSTDGSALRIDSERLVDNDGVHEIKSVCKDVTLVPGRHSMSAEGFKGSRGSLEMKLTYSGPDTGGLSVPVRSVGTRNPPVPWASQWLLRVYRPAGSVHFVPGDPRSSCKRVGEAVLPVVDLAGGGGAGDFRKWVPATPLSNFVYEVFGKLQIASRGEYRLCVTSKDGSKMFADGDLVVSNDGVHQSRTRCGVKTMTTGLHLIKVVGFKGDGLTRLALKYQGPDTKEQRVDMQSLDASPF